jgi:exodeoxyribonuclease VII small subunit
MSDDKNDGLALSFGEAISELETILGRIEAEETDIDELAGQLERATRLLDVCRGKIKKAETEVNQIVADLESATTAPGTEAERDPS